VVKPYIKDIIHIHAYLTWFHCFIVSLFQVDIPYRSHIYNDSQFDQDTIINKYEIVQAKVNEVKIIMNSVTH
jgi:hypothetical protein